MSGCGGGEDLCGGPFCVVPPGPAQARQLRPGAGDGQTGTPGRPLPLPLEVVVTDDEDQPVPSVEVGFSVAEGSGTLSAQPIRTDYQGRAQVTWTLGTELGFQRVRVVANDASGAPLEGSPLSFSAQSVPPRASRLVLRQAPSGQAQNGVPFARQPEVEVLDDAGEPVAGASVAAAITAGDGTLTGTSTLTTDAAGRAAFTDLAIAGTAGSRTLSFAVTDPPVEAVTATVEVQAGPAARLAGNEPLVYTGTVGSPVSPAPSVTVTDDAGNPVAGAPVAFAADLDASVSPTTVTTDAAGTARVASWTLGNTGGGRYTLTASLPDGDPVTFTAEAQAATAGRLAVEVQPSASVRSGVPFTRQPVVRSPVPGLVVTATLSLGPAGTLQNATATADANGVATFNGLTLSGAVGEYRLAFSAPNVAGVNSRRFTLTAGTAGSLQIVQQPSSDGRSRVPLARQPVLQLHDGQGNPVAQSGIQVTAGLANGGGTLGGGTSVVTDAVGRATFTDLTIIGAPGPRILRFASANPAAEAFSTSVTLPEAATVTVTRAPTEPVVVGTTLANPVAWQVTDAAGLPVADVPTAVSVSAGSSIGSFSTTSDANGGVELQSWTVAQTAGVAYVDLDVSNAGSARAVVQVVPGAATQLVKISGDDQSAPAGSQLAEPLVVRVVDDFGNGVSGVTVEWRTCDGSGDYNVATDGAGFASALQTTGTEAGTLCVMASSAGLTGSPVMFSYTVTSGESSVRVPAPPPSPARTGTAQAEPPRL